MIIVLIATQQVMHADVVVVQSTQHTVYAITFNEVNKFSLAVVLHSSQESISCLLLMELTTSSTILPLVVVCSMQVPTRY